MLLRRIKGFSADSRRVLASSNDDDSDESDGGDDTEADAVRAQAR